MDERKLERRQEGSLVLIASRHQCLIHSTLSNRLLLRLTNAKSRGDTGTVCRKQSPWKRPQLSFRKGTREAQRRRVSVCGLVAPVLDPFASIRQTVNRTDKRQSPMGNVHPAGLGVGQYYNNRCRKQNLQERPQLGLGSMNGT